MPRTGFLLGKFLPLHRGHMHLIETARGRVERLTVLVCSLAREPIPGELRYRWVHDLYPDVTVLHCAEELPSYPHEHPDFWGIWREVVIRYCGGIPPEVVFTSEDYGDKLAAVLGARHECVDLARAAFPVSGTTVRADPRAHWHMLPPAVQDYYSNSQLPISNWGFEVGSWEFQLLVIVWRITEICNLGCGFCAYSRDVHRSRAAANLDEVRAFGGVLSDYAHATDCDVLVSWLGGEPLLWPPLWEISRAFAHAGGLRVSATTNGTALRSESVRQHLVDDFSELTLSVDGVGHRHDELRGAPGLFDEMRANVLALRELRQRCGRGPRLRVNTVLMRDNIFELESLCRELATWGVGELTFNALGGRDRPEFFPAHRLLPEHLAWLRRELPGLRERSAALGLAILGNERYLERLEASALTHHLPITECHPGQRFLFVDEQGRVAPCSFTADDYGVHLRDLRTADDVRRLPAHFAALRTAHRAPVCADCPSTQVFGKFG